MDVEYVDPFLSRLHEVSKATSDEALPKLKFFAELAGAPVSKLDNATSVEDIYHILKEHCTKGNAIALLQAMLSVIGVNVDKVSSLGSTSEALSTCRKLPNFRFGKLIIEICNSLKKEHFDSLKNLLGDHLNGLHLDKVRSAEHMFSILIRGQKITPHNLQLLASSLKQIGLLDCVQLVEEFQKNSPPQCEDPENGITVELYCINK